MSPRLKLLSGPDVIAIFADFGFRVFAQRGSHVKLRRLRPDGACQSLTIPNHKDIDRGTLRAIIRQGSKFIPEADLYAHFYLGDRSKG